MTQAPPLARLWERVRRPVDVPAAVEALIGIPASVAHQLVSVTVAASDEATALLEAMPDLIRNLSISTVSIPERSVGEVRGPVLWSETITARSASAGDQNVWVCATSARAYDTPENRILAAALTLVARGGQQVARMATADDEPPQVRTARRNGEAARRFLDHRAIAGIRHDRISRRALARLRHDPRRRSYRPVTDMLRLADDPLTPETLDGFCDTPTRSEHELLLAVVDQLERRGIRLPPFLVSGQALAAGPLRYRRIADVTDPDHGVHIGPVRVVLGSDLATDDAVPVTGRSSLVAAVDHAIVTAGL